METQTPRSRPLWPWLAGLGALAALGGLWVLVKGPGRKKGTPLASSAPQPEAAKPAPQAPLALKIEDTQEQLPAALVPFTPKLQEMLDKVNALAKPMGLIGWPVDLGHDPGWPVIIDDPLLNRVWGNNQVLWHTTPDAKHWNALVVMSASGPSAPNLERKSYVVLVSDVFGTPSLKKLVEAPYPRNELSRGTNHTGKPLDDEVAPTVPDFVKTGTVWVFYQGCDSSCTIYVWAYHPSVGLASEIYLESKAEHAAGLAHDAELTAKAKANGGIFNSDEEFHSAEHENFEHPSDVFTDDIATGASEVKFIEGIVFFKLKGKGPFFTSAETWAEWTQKSTTNTPSPNPAP